MLVRIVFPDPGFFLNDPHCQVSLDRRTVYDGSFRGGFDVSLEVAPGRHEIETAIKVGALTRRQRIPLPLAEGGYRDVAAVEVKLAYSRFWGNFAKRVEISTHG